MMDVSPSLDGRDRLPFWSEYCIISLNRRQAERAHKPWISIGSPCERARYVALALPDPRYSPSTQYPVLCDCRPKRIITYIKDQDGTYCNSIVLAHKRTHTQRRPRWPTLLLLTRERRGTPMPTPRSLRSREPMLPMISTSADEQRSQKLTPPNSRKPASLPSLLPNSPKVAAGSM
jgi:hypothetical protein